MPPERKVFGEERWLFPIRPTLKKHLIIFMPVHLRLLLELAQATVFCGQSRSALQALKGLRREWRGEGAIATHSSLTQRNFLSSWPRTGLSHSRERPPEKREGERAQKELHREVLKVCS